MGDFWVIVNSLGTNHPRPYILLPHEVQALAVRNRSGKTAYWLPLKQYAVDAFEEQWPAHWPATARAAGVEHVTAHSGRVGLASRPLP